MRGGRDFWALVAAGLLPGAAVAQAPGIAAPPVGLTQGREPIAMTPSKAESFERTFPINLATAMRLANARPIDVQVAEQSVAVAARQLDRAKLLWVPNLVVGADFFRHTGGQQNFAGEILRSDRGSAMVGFGPNVVFNITDAIYAPLAAKQDLKVRRAAMQTATNDATFAVAEAYFHVQQARGELAGALLAAQRADDVSKKAEALAEGLAPPLEASRAKVELARRQQASTAARERWRTASAELGRLLRLEPGTLIEPMEPPFLPITVIPGDAALDALIPLGLTNRPELQGQQAFVQATLARLKQEKLRPLVPSLALRSVSTNPSGSLGYGAFAGGPGSTLGGSGSRFDLDFQVLWEFQSLGFGNKARIGERQAEYQIATLELFRTQDRIAAEIAAAFAQGRAASERMAQAEPALKEALNLVEKSLLGMAQTRRLGEVNVLVVRPQEVVAAVQALGQANADFYSAVGDYNRAQFRLYRALGHPAQLLPAAVPQPAAPNPTPPGMLPPAPLLNKLPAYLPNVPIPDILDPVACRTPGRRGDWPPIVLALLQRAAKRTEPVEVEIRHAEFVEPSATWGAPKSPEPVLPPLPAPLTAPKYLPPPLEEPTQWARPAYLKK